MEMASRRSMKMASRIGRAVRAAKIGGLEALILPAFLLAIPMLAQAQTQTSQGSQALPSARPQWEIAAGGTMRFEAASIHKDGSGIFQKPSFALSLDDGLPPLLVYIQFAYKQWFTQQQVEALLTSAPRWVQTDVYEIQARAAGKPSKDQMRLMLQSLLSDRFGLRIHFETRRMPFFILMLVKPGKMGPRLHPHSPTCNIAGLSGNPAGKTSAAKGSEAKAAAAKDIFPPLCLDQSLMTIPKPNHVKLTGSRNMPMPVLATYLTSIGNLDRPVIDRTGIGESVDFSLEFTPEAYLPENSGASADSDMPVTSFQEALQNQLGLMLVPAKGPQDVLVVDHVERPQDPQE
jgi:bla regulator protein BlaR1